MNMSDSFSAFRDRLLSRHENSLTDVLSTVGDVVLLGAIAAAVVTRRMQVGVIGAAAGTAVIVGAHLFQPGTMRDEITEVLRHPVWGLRAEAERIFGRRT
jgi:hypothetical protein